MPKGIVGQQTSVIEHRDRSRGFGGDILDDRNAGVDGRDFIGGAFIGLRRLRWGGRQPGKNRQDEVNARESTRRIQ